MNNERKRRNESDLDWISMIVPLLCVAFLCVVFVIKPGESRKTLEEIRFFLGNDLGLYYAILGMGIFLVTLYIAFSKFGNIKLGKEEDQPMFSSFTWGTMIFTSTMAADIIFYSLCEWAIYANEPYIKSLGDIQKWAPTYPLFHWGPIAWSFYIILAVAFGFMLYVRKQKKQKFSEACRPLLGSKVDGIFGKVIDLIAIFALIAGTATTFSLATPLLSAATAKVFRISNGVYLTIEILLLIAVLYTIVVWFGIKGVSKMASYCTYIFFVLLAYFLFAGGETRYILETGFSSLGNMTQNFLGMGTWIDPLRKNSFPQNWTIYYWAYWMVWSVATPFFIGKISKGRTIKNLILGGYSWGLAGTFVSFIILGNYGMAQQMKHGVNIVGFIGNGGSYVDAIMKIFETLPFPTIALLILLVNMILFYVTTFDSITMVISSYSYKQLPVDKEPHRNVRIFWSIMFIMFPIALILGKVSMYSLQSVAIIAAFPIGIIMLIIIFSFFKDAKSYLK